MSQCHALTKDERLCRNYAEVLEEDTDTVTYSGFCHMHTSRYLPKPVFYRLASNLEWSNSRRTHIEYLLREGHFEVKFEHIRNIQVGNKYSYFLLLCSRYVKGFHRNWNPLLFDNAVFNLWEMSNAVYPVEIKQEDFHTLANVSSWFVVARLCPLNQYNQKKWRDWLWKYFDTQEGMAFLFDTSIDLLIEEIEQWLSAKQPPLAVTFMKMMDLSKKVAKAKCRVRMNKIREDLVKTTWHPSRVMDWCFDQEDREFFGL